MFNNYCKSAEIFTANAIEYLKNYYRRFSREKLIMGNMKLKVQLVLFSYSPSDVCIASHIFLNKKKLLNLRKI